MYHQVVFNPQGEAIGGGVAEEGAFQFKVSDVVVMGVRYFNFSEEERHWYFRLYNEKDAIPLRIQGQKLRPDPSPDGQRCLSHGYLGAGLSASGRMLG